MKALVVIAFAVLAVVALSAFLRVAPTHSATANDINGLVAALTNAQGSPAFFVLMFVPPGAAEGDVVNLQYSVEGGKAGLDWGFLAPRNIADRDNIHAFIRSLGHAVEEKEMNRVRYLRVEDKSIEELGFKVITDFYKMSATTSLELITEGFEWCK